MPTLSRFTRAPALLLATGMLALSFTGGAAAASLLTGADLKDGTVTGADLRDGTVKARDLADGTRSALAGVGGYEVVTGGQPYVAPHAFATVTVTCPDGKVPLSAGVRWESGLFADSQVYLTDARTGYVARSFNPADYNDDMVVEVVCALPG